MSHLKGRLSEVKTWILSAAFLSRVTANAVFSGATDTVQPSHEAIQNLKEGEDDVYFNSYGHFSIHAEMLKVSGG